MKLLALLIALSQVTMASDEIFEADIAAVDRVADFISNLNQRLDSLDNVMCSSASDRGDEIPMDAPVCNFQDVCDSVVRENGFLKLNGVQVPDYLLKNKVERMRNRVAACYDQMAETEDFNSFIVDDLVNDLLGKDDAAKFRNDIRNSILDVVEIETVRDREGNASKLLPELTYSGLESYVNEERAGTLQLEKVLDYLAMPDSEGIQQRLVDSVQSEDVKRRLQDFIAKENVSRRQDLLNRFQKFQKMDGFYELERAPIDLEAIDASEMTATLKGELAELVRNKALNRGRGEYFQEKLAQAEIIIPDKYDDNFQCDQMYGPPAYVLGKKIVICPKAHSLPKETLMAILGHEVGHLIDPCSCVAHNYFAHGDLWPEEEAVKEHFVVRDSFGNPLKSPAIRDYPFRETLNCIKGNEVTPVRMFNPEDRSLNMRKSDHICFLGGARDQSGETFSDIVSMNLNEKRIQDFSPEQAQRYTIGLALTKPYKCLENKNFTDNPYDQELEELDNELNKYNCVESLSRALPLQSEQEKYHQRGPHLSMQARVDHIYMNDTIQEKLGCKNEKGKSANASVSCDF